MLGLWRQRLLSPLRHGLPAIPPPTPRRLWPLLAALVAPQNGGVFLTAQPDRFTLPALAPLAGRAVTLSLLSLLRPRRFSCVLITLRSQSRRPVPRDLWPRLLPGVQQALPAHERS